ncbi:hypothetical protein LLG95_05665 [bacterium]|nr:hypothetical protein [bacterium]
MKLRFSWREARLKWPIMEAFRATARQSLGSDGHDVISFTIHYQTVENESHQNDLGEDPGDDFSKTLGRTDQPEA